MFLKRVLYKLNVHINYNILNFTLPCTILHNEIENMCEIENIYAEFSTFQY